MNFDAFLNILEGKYWVQRRVYFLDAKEKGEIPFHKRLCLHYVGENAPTFNPQYIKTENEKKEAKYRLLNKSRYLLTSCWTIDNGEDYLMWKSYTDRCGVCVRTTIGRLLEAINSKEIGYIPICSPVSYGGVEIRDSITSMVVSKERYYSSENEVRFYFVKNDHFINEDMESLDTARVEVLLEKTIEDESNMREIENGENRSVTFYINPTFIKSVVLSPFILSSSIQYMKKIISNSYPSIFNGMTIIKESDIKINL